MLRRDPTVVRLRPNDIEEMMHMLEERANLRHAQQEQQQQLRVKKNNS